MKTLNFRRFSTQIDPKSQKFPNPNSPIPIPHRSIPDARGADHDFVQIFHSHLTRSEWPKLVPLARGLTPFRATHLLLKLRHDPVLSLQFYDFALSHSPSPQTLTLESHSVLLHTLAASRRFRSAESILRRTLIPRNPSSDLFDAILGSYRLCCGGGGPSSPGAFDSLFKAYAHAKKFRDASETFCRMRSYGLLPPVRSCNAYISSLLSLGRSDIALAFYREMRRSRISPNVYTLNMVMAAFCGSGRLDKALDVFGKMEAMGFSPTVASFNTVIAGYCSSGLVGAALKHKDEMRARGLVPSVITYNTLIHGFCKDGKPNEAYKVFNEMKAAEVKPTAATYTILIGGYSRTNSGETGLRIYEEMVKDGVEAGVLTYNALITGLCNGGKTKKAAHLVKELGKANLAPNASTFSALISGQCGIQNSERAFQIYKAMKRSGCHPNCDTFELLISAFCKNKDFAGALEVLRDMLEGWMAPDKALLNELFEGLSRSGKGHLGVELLSGMNKERLIPEGFLDYENQHNQLERASQ